jgi:exodeoxyribonuclease V alpha subunit
MNSSNEPDLAAIDEAFGRFVARKGGKWLTDPHETQLVGRTAALVSAERALGNSCLDMARVARPETTATGEPEFPDSTAWGALLLRSGVCTGGEGTSPLVLDNGRVYLRRFHNAERRVAEAIRSRIADGGEKSNAFRPELIALFRVLFPNIDGEVDWQGVAAAGALRSRLLFIAGGPGTGKTTVAARILALLLHEQPSLRISLAAPTGRAATRLAEAVAAASVIMPVSDDIRCSLPQQGTTLHRLLGYNPQSDRFRFGPENLLTEDVIVVDETSMVDLLMMDVLFRALRPSARIIMLGDPDQLMSVDTGFVIGDIARAASSAGETYGTGRSDAYAALSGVTLPIDPLATPIRDAVVRLRRSYRFEEQQGIGLLATAIQVQNADAALDVLRDANFPDVSLLGGSNPDESQSRARSTLGMSSLLATLLPHIDAYLAATSPIDALRALSAFRVLCALRNGRTGVEGINAAIERLLRSRGLDTHGWYDHRPVLIAVNDPATELFNGDVGMTLSIDGRTEVFFLTGSDAVRSMSPSRLPSHVTAWAMTVHKAQGSEFDHVFFVLPEADSRVLSRELLYTAVTRAKKSVAIAGSEDILRVAMGRSAMRASGLERRLT